MPQSTNAKIVAYIAKKHCRDVKELLDYAKQLGITRQNLFSRLSTLKKRGIIKVHKYKDKNKLRTRYCIAASVAEILETII